MPKLVHHNWKKHLTIFTEDRCGQEILQNLAVSLERTLHFLACNKLRHLFSQLPKFLHWGKNHSVISFVFTYIAIVTWSLNSYPWNLILKRCISQWTKSGSFCCYVTVFSQLSIVIQQRWRQLFPCIISACLCARPNRRNYLKIYMSGRKPVGTSFVEEVKVFNQETEEGNNNLKR